MSRIRVVVPLPICVFAVIAVVLTLFAVQAERLLEAVWWRVAA